MILVIGISLLSVYSVGILMTAPCPGEIAFLKGSSKSPVHSMSDLDFKKY